MRDGTTILNLEQSVKKADGLEECAVCSRYFPASDTVKSDLLDYRFCSSECRDEAEQESENTRITDINPRAY